MLCPRCKSLLRLGSGTKTQPDFWECSKCWGRAVDAAHVHQLLDNKFDRWLWELAKDSDPSFETRCPRCLHYMHPAVLESHKGPVEIDACLSCQCVWFDQGEIQELIDETFIPKDQPVEQEGIEILRVNRSPDALLQSVLGLPIPDDGFKWNDTVSWVACVIVMVSLYCFHHEEWAELNLSFTPGLAVHTHRYTWVSSFFVHANWGHLLGNLYFFFIVGAAIEEFLGSTGFLLLLLISIIGGDLAVLLFEHAGRMIPHIGASGGIAGLMAYFSIKFPNKRISIAQFFGFRLLRFHLPVWVAFSLFILYQCFSYVMTMAGHGSSISYMCHLGGAAAGVLYFLLF